MILQSLVHLYDELSRQGKVAREGWGIAKVSHRLVLDEEGGLIGIVSARKKVLRGKKEKEIPSDMMVPLPATRSSGVKANFLCDNSSYFWELIIKESRRGRRSALRRQEPFIIRFLTGAIQQRPGLSFPILTTGM